MSAPHYPYDVRPSNHRQHSSASQHQYMQQQQQQQPHRPLPHTQGGHYAEDGRGYSAATRRGFDDARSSGSSASTSYQNYYYGEDQQSPSTTRSRGAGSLSGGAGSNSSSRSGAAQDRWSNNTGVTSDYAPTTSSPGYNKVDDLAQDLESSMRALGHSSEASMSAARARGHHLGLTNDGRRPSSSTASGIISLYANTDPESASTYGYDLPSQDSNLAGARTTAVPNRQESSSPSSSSSRRGDYRPLPRPPPSPSREAYASGNAEPPTIGMSASSSYSSYGDNNRMDSSSRAPQYTHDRMLSVNDSIHGQYPSWSPATSVTNLPISEATTPVMGHRAQLNPQGDGGRVAAPDYSAGDYYNARQRQDFYNSEGLGLQNTTTSDYSTTSSDSAYGNGSGYGHEPSRREWDTDLAKRSSLIARSAALPNSASQVSLSSPLPEASEERQRQNSWQQQQQQSAAMSAMPSATSSERYKSPASEERSRYTSNSAGRRLPPPPAQEYLESLQASTESRRTIRRPGEAAAVSVQQTQQGSVSYPSEPDSPSYARANTSIDQQYSTTFPQQFQRQQSLLQSHPQMHPQQFQSPVFGTPSVSDSTHHADGEDRHGARPPPLLHRAADSEVSSAASSLSSYATPASATASAAQQQRYGSAAYDAVLLSPTSAGVGAGALPVQNMVNRSDYLMGNGTNEWGEQDEVDLSLLSTIALLLRDSVPRGMQIKGSVSYPHSFTGKDVVSTIQALIPREHLAWAAGVAAGTLDETQERKIALLMAKSLKSQLFFHEVDWGTNDLCDGVEEVYMFLEDSLAGPEGADGQGLASGGGGGEGGVRRGRREAPNDFERELQLAMHGGMNDTKGGKKGLVQADSDLDELPTGVFTPLTACYSPLCGKPGSPAGASCYSRACPRARSSPLDRTQLFALRNDDGLLSPGLTSPGGDGAIGRGASGSGARTGSRSASISGGDGSGGVGGAKQASASHMAVAWADTVPKELLASIPRKEVKRQNAILETIQKEEEFLNDLELLDTLFLDRLQRPSAAGDPPPIPIGPAREHFIVEVFSNHRELVGHIRRLVERLHVRQREEHPIVQSIGDIFLDASLEWGGAFDTNMTNFPIAKNRIQREANINPRFKEFLEECRRDPACHRLPMDNFLQRATTRLPRYVLHFKSILSDTEESNPDRESLARAIEIVDEQCKAIQKGVAAAEVKVKIREYAYNLATKRNKAAIDLDLLNPERQLVHQGKVHRKPDFTDFEWQDLLAVLFDNYLVVTKTKMRQEGDHFSSKFVLAKRPIPIEMMELSGFNEPSVSKSIGLTNFPLHLRSTTAERESRDIFPFTVHHIGGKVEPLTLYTPSKQARDEWKHKLEEAIGLRAAVQEANKVFDTHTLSEDVFAIPTASALDQERPPPGVDSNAFHGRVTCAVPFATTDGRRLVAIGCADGVWIGLRSDPRSLRKVLHLKLVTQCAVLESFGIFVVLADKILISYSLEALVPSAGATTAPKPPQKLSGNRDVLMFSVGTLKERTLLVYMKKKANESVFRALEPIVAGTKSENVKGGTSLFGKFGKESKSSDWFRIYKTFFIPSEAYSMQFLRSKLCVVCARGFEIMNLDNLLPGTIPDFSQSPRDDPRIQMLAKRVETSKPLGMFKNSESEFLLCYDNFACYVDRQGEPIRLDNIIEWEGTPQNVAFRAPFILAFDSRFIEVRDSSSGKLVQLIKATDLRYVSGSSTLASTTSVGHGIDHEDSIILVQRKRSTGSARHLYDYQRVFEIVSMLPPMQYAAPGSAGPSSASASVSGFTTPTTTGSSAASSFGFAQASNINNSSPYHQQRHPSTSSLTRQGTSMTTRTFNSAGSSNTGGSSRPANVSGWI